MADHAADVAKLKAFQREAILLITVTTFMAILTFNVGLLTVAIFWGAITIAGVISLVCLEMSIRHFS